MDQPFPVHEPRPQHSPEARISEGDSQVKKAPNASLKKTLATLHGFLMEKGDFSNLLTDDQITTIAQDVIDEWEMDKGSLEAWRKMAQLGLDSASQDTNDEYGSSFPWEGSSNIHFPILTQATQQWAARAYPELVKGDKVVKALIISQPSKQPSASQETQAAAPPPQQMQQGAQAAQALQQNPQAAQQNPQAAQALVQQAQGAQQAQQQVTTQLQQDQQADNVEQLAMLAKQAQGERIAAYMNWKIFYGMDGEWVSDTDLLLHQLPITGCGFKKVYMGDTGLCSDYISPLNLTVNNNTKSMARCPRITHDFEMYPNEIEEAQRSGRFREVDLDQDGEDLDEETPRTIIEQLCLRDLDEDGLKEPYLITVDVESRELLRIEPAFGAKDVKINEAKGKITRISRWNPYPDFVFFPDPKGNFYGTGFAKLLEPITDSIDTAVNQMFDAATAQNAGGGFISSGVRLMGSGQGGSLWFQPGQYQSVDTKGADLKDAIWTRPVPEASPIMMDMMNVMISFAKDIASIKDVATGDSSTMAPVGTTLAVQGQALQVFSSIYKRVHEGFKKEFKLMYECLKRFATDRERREYQLITGGDLDQDFGGDAQDVIQPVSDPTVVTKMQKLARIQAMQQFAESPIGQAAGMTQAAPAQAMALEVLEVMEIERPERFIAVVPPNPMMAAETQAKVQAMQAKAALDQANAQKAGTESQNSTQKTAADVSLAHAKVIREMGLSALDTEEAHEKVSMASSPDDDLKSAQTHKVNSDTSLNHAKTIRELGLAHKDMMPEPDED